jgi:N6-L-threonylcarbamoyladenine synthase
MSQTVVILGLETSCDDTSVAILKKDGDKIEILSHLSLNSEKVLALWGGVVPEIAAREHVKAIAPLVELALKEANLTLKDLQQIAVTTSPGLIGALLTGLHAAKTLAWLHELPITPVPHLWAHLEAVHLTHTVEYPYLGLLVSGGNTLIVKVDGANLIEVLGQTLDDAAGEAFDKAGKMMGLGYPAGRQIDELAQKGDENKYSFPISYLRDRPGKMSFSGLKTSMRVFLEKNPDAPLIDVCASYQKAIVTTLLEKVQEVRKLHNLGELPIVVGGGVACNSGLRFAFQKKFPEVYFVEPKFCSDNAAMIAHWALRSPETSVSFPDCLSLDAKSRFFDKPSVKVS